MQYFFNFTFTSIVSHYPHHFICYVSKQRCAYLIHVFKGVDDVIGQARKQVYDKPGLQVVHTYELWVRYNLPSRTHKSGMEVQHNIHKEDYVHHTVQNQPHQVVLFGLKGDIVGNHDGCVEGEDENDPVPCGLKGAVVQDDVRWSFRSLLLVLRKNVGA